MKVNIEDIYEKTLEHYSKAKENLLKSEAFFEHSAAISNAIPGFDAEKLEFGSYDKENFAVLFVDMRLSTKRAKLFGAQITFLTMHVFLTALLEVVKCYNGKVIDIMGDGLMVFWGGKNAREKKGETNSLAIKQAGLCGRDMLLIRDRVINPIIKNNNLGSQISIGVGVTFGSVIVTKIGISDSYDVKAFGDCINTASKYADSVFNKVKVSKKIKNEWPSSKGGKIRFISSGNESFLLETSK